MSTFTESEERQELRRQVARLASGYGRDWFVERARAGEKTTELWMEIAKAGYLGINVPEEYGGGGGGIGDVAAVCEELAAQGCPLLMMVVSPAICGTVNGPSIARLRMKPKAPPPQLVISPVFWPAARILKKHCATSSITPATASAFLVAMPIQCAELTP